MPLCGNPGGYFPPRRYQRGHFLFDTLLDTFLVKEKYPRGWAAQAHREIFVLCKLPFGAGGNIHSASNQNFRKVLAFVGSCRPHWQFLSCEKKGTKDSQGTGWFLDLQQKGAMPPLDTPNDARSFCGKRGGASRSDCGGDFPPRRYQRGYFLFDTLLDTFLVKEKYPQEWAA